MPDLKEVVKSANHSPGSHFCAALCSPSLPTSPAKARSLHIGTGEGKHPCELKEKETFHSGKSGINQGEMWKSRCLEGEAVAARR